MGKQTQYQTSVSVLFPLVSCNSTTGPAGLESVTKLSLSQWGRVWQWLTAGGSERDNIYLECWAAREGECCDLCLCSDLPGYVQFPLTLPGLPLLWPRVGCAPLPLLLCPYRELQMMLPSASRLRASLLMPFMPPAPSGRKKCCSRSDREFSVRYSVSHLLSLIPSQISW